MSPSFQSSPSETEVSTQELPTIPTVQDMKNWDEKKVLQWIQQRYRTILKGHNLETFKKERFTGSAFLLSNFDIFKKCNLPPGVSLALEHLANEVKKGKFIPWT